MPCTLTTEARWRRPFGKRKAYDVWVRQWLLLKIQDQLARQIPIADNGRELKDGPSKYGDNDDDYSLSNLQVHVPKPVSQATFCQARLT